ncbi:Myoneurin-like 4, partial [Homarus americanus]
NKRLVRRHTAVNEQLFTCASDWLPPLIVCITGGQEVVYCMMETEHKKGVGGVKDSPVKSTLMFHWDELSSNLMQALQGMGVSHKGTCCGPQPEVHIRIGEEMTVHATLLAALSSSWREYLNTVMNQSLIYCGSATSPFPLLKEVMAVVRALDLDNTQYIHSSYKNNVHTLYWKGYEKMLIKAFQFMCSYQLCTDVSLLVDKHIIRAHKLILSACSSVLQETFQENGRIGMIHLPSVNMMNAQNLITYMYYGEATVMESHLLAFHKLCSSLEVKSLMKATKRYIHQESQMESEEQFDYLKLQAHIKSSSESVWSRLRQLYDGEKKADVTFLVEKKRLSAHKALLCAASPVIHDIIAQEPTGEHSLIVMIDANHKFIEGFLEMVYNGCCSLVHRSGTVICSYFDRTVFHIEYSQDKIPINTEADHVLQEEESKPRLQFLIKEGSRSVTQSPSSVMMTELCEATASTTARKNRNSPGNCPHLLAHSEAADEESIESTKLQKEEDSEMKDCTIPKWGTSMADTTELKLRRDTYENSNNNLSVRRLGTNVERSVTLGLRKIVSGECNLECSKPLDVKKDNIGGEKISKHLQASTSSVECASSVESDSSGVCSSSCGGAVEDKTSVKNRRTKSQRVYSSPETLKRHHHQVNLKIPQDDVYSKESSGRCTKTSQRTSDVREHEEDLPYNYEHGDKSFAEQRSMAQLFKSRVVKRKKVTCKLCGKTNSRRDLWKHVKTHRRSCPCPRCPKIFSPKKFLDDHGKAEHSGVVHHTCKICSETFTSYSRLLHHMFQIHLVRETMEYACSKCELVFKTEKLLLAHMQSLHHIVPVKTYKCSICNIAFRDRRALLKHNRTLHKHEKPFTCSGCDKQFKSSKTMKSHERKCQQSAPSQPAECERGTQVTQPFTPPPAPANLCVHCGQ